MREATANMYLMASSVACLANSARPLRRGPFAIAKPARMDYPARHDLPHL